MSSMRRQCTHAQGPGFQRGPSTVTGKGHDFYEAPLPSCTRARISIRPHYLQTQGPGFQSGPTALVHMGHGFNEAPVRSCTWAMGSMKPQCAHALGHGFNEAPVCSCTGAMSTMRRQCAHAQGPGCPVTPARGPAPFGAAIPRRRSVGCDHQLDKTPRPPIQWAHTNGGCHPTRALRRL